MDEMRIVRFIGIIALLFFVGISFSCGRGGVEPATFSIPGTVTLDGVGLSGVTMTLFEECIQGGLLAPNCTPHVAATTTTDSNGNYQFDAGVDFYDITPSKDGFTFDPWSHRISVFSQGILEYPGQGGNIQGVARVNFTASRV
jgi:hypothetical protein